MADQPQPIDPADARRQYDDAREALRSVINDPAATSADLGLAEAAIDDLTFEFIERNIADVRARSAHFAVFIRRMEDVIARAGKDPVLKGIKNLQRVVTAARDIIDPLKELFADAAGAPVKGDPQGGKAPPAIPAGAAAPALAGRPGGRKARKGARAAGVDDSPSFPKTTRAEAKDRRPAEPARTAADTIRSRVGPKLDAQPDRIDPRDWIYEPTLRPLPDAMANVNPANVLDQGQEGACTGFALAAVINHHLTARKLPRRVSPRMLYEMARRYDEWPGEQYEGSSARGGIKGWVAHGVCSQKHWPNTLFGPQHLSQDVAVDALATPGGAYYRVMHREVRDLHAALAEAGAIYATLMVHDGWADPSGKPQTIELGGRARALRLPVIQRKGRASSGHAVALVGYNRDGFVVQNSWGRKWGKDGFALLPYEDFLIHATDVWVAQLGVPVAMDLWSARNGGDSAAGLHRASQAVPLEAVRPFVINVGNNGELSGGGEYWTMEEDVKRLFTKTIPDRVRDEQWKTKRVMLYLHGGLNAEAEVAKRVVAFKDVMLENEIYPLHVMWETGAMESLKNIVGNLFSGQDERAGGAREWMRKLRDNLVEAKDRSFEFTVAGAGTTLWDEMKRNARLASEHRLDRGGMQVVARYVKEAMAAVDAKARGDWELHVVAHSAGSIFAAYAIPHLIDPALGIKLKSIQLMAPAITADLFKSRVLPHVAAGTCPVPTNYILSDVGERDDTVWEYGKSLLYLVSHAFEGRRDTRLVGMERYVSDRDAENGSRFVDQELNLLFKQSVDLRNDHFPTGLPSLVVAGKGPRTDPEADPKAWGVVSRSEKHGAFDNDPETMNSVLYRILGKRPQRWFTSEDLAF